MSRSCRQIAGQFGMLFSVLDCRAGVVNLLTRAEWMERTQRNGLPK